MTESITQRLKGIIPPVTTPLTDAGFFDGPSAETLYTRMLEAGVDGLFLFGSSGEGPVLAPQTRNQALQTAIGVAGGSVPVIAGVLAPGTDQVIELAQTALRLGADGLVVAAPFYYPATQPELLAHYRAIGNAVGLPILLYDIPRATNVKIELETLLALSEEETVVALKDSSGDMTAFRRLLERRPARFRMFTGSELLVDSALLMGADGAVPGLANVAPELFTQLYDHWKAARLQDAQQVQKRIVRLFDVFVAPDGSINSGYVLGAMKTGQMLRGWIATNRTSAPFPRHSQELESRTRQILIEAGLL